MKRASFKFLFAIAGLCIGFGFGAGCATQGEDAGSTVATTQGANTDEASQPAGGLAPAPAETDDTGADIGGGGGSCPAYQNCYSVCRLVHNCGLHPDQCDALGQCLDRCDAEFQSCVGQ